MTPGNQRSEATVIRSAEGWARLEEVVHAALDVPTAERETLVRLRCRNDAALCEAALAWLRACERGKATLDTPIGAEMGLDALRAAEQGGELDSHPGIRASMRAPGTRVGAWRVLGEIGRGGMGAVYLAERADAELPMKAALKFMHLGVSLDPVGTRRFRDERRILAALEHPSIARLLDGGTDTDGVRWFAMEHIAGTPIDAWCDARALNVEDRLRLFCRVAEAVQHAHARLVIHRDLKPANILVTEAGEPRLLDFGIAKLLSTGEPSDPALTRPGMQPMTVAYAAPEQLCGEPPSTATDVFALGVLLHVMLSGHLPFEVRPDDAVEMHLTMHRTVPRVSEAVLRTRRAAGEPDDAELPARIAAARGTSPPRLARRLRGDLDTIVARAMHADAARRYPTAEALAADVRRHIHGRPVLARPDTVGYRMRKLIARNPIGSLLGAAAVVLILGFTVVTAVQASLLGEQANRLRAERDKAAEVTQFLAGVLASANPYQETGRVPTLRDVLDRGAEQAAVSLGARPEVRAHLLSAMAPAYFGLGDWDRAGEMAAEAVELRRRTLGSTHPEVAAALVYLANVRLNQGRAREAERQVREAIAIQRLHHPTESLDTLRLFSTLGAALQKQGRLVEAAGVLRSLLAVERARTPRDPAALAQVARNLAHVLRDARRYDEAVPLYSEAYALHRTVYGDDHPESANSAVNLGNARMLAGDAAGAVPLLRRGVAVKRRLLGIHHHDVAGDQLTLARALDAAGAKAEAETLRREAEGALRKREP